MDQLTTEQILWMLATTAAMLNFAGWGSYVAAQKDRAWYEGVAAGVLLGPFGPILIACLPTLEPEQTAAEALGGTLRQSRDQHDDALMRHYTDAEWAKRTLKDGAKPRSAKGT